MADYATWNPSDKNANITLSGSDLTATAANTSWKSARATIGNSSGKWYWEITVDVSSDNRTTHGVGSLSATLNDWVGSDDYGWGYAGITGYKYHSDIGVVYGSTFAAGSVIGVALDLDDGKIWWAKNGVWQASGNPATGANPAYTGLSGTCYPMCTCYAINSKITANFGASAFSYSVPAGFNSGFYEGVENNIIKPSMLLVF